MNNKYKPISVAILLCLWIPLISYFTSSEQYSRAVGLAGLPLVAVGGAFLLKNPHWALACIGLSYTLNTQIVLIRYNEQDLLTSNIILVLICFFSFFSKKNDLQVTIDKKYFVSLVIYIFYALISYYVSHGKFNYFEINKYVNNLIIFFLTCLFLDSYYKIAIFLNVIVVGSLVLFAFGIFQLAEQGHIAGSYMTGYFSNHVMYGLHLALGAIFSFFFYRTTRSKVYFFCTVALVSGVLLAYSRGVIFSFIMSIIFCTGAIYAKKSKHKKILNFIMLALFLVGTISIYSYLINKVEYGSSKEKVTKGRSLLYQAGWEAFKAHPYLGIGWDNFKLTWSDYVDISSPSQRWGKVVTEKTLNPHSSYMKILSELGLGGVGLFILFNIFLFRALYPVFLSREGLPLFIVLLLFYLLGITDNNSYGNDRMFYFATGLLFSIKTLKQKEEKAGADPLFY